MEDQVKSRKEKRMERERLHRLQQRTNVIFGALLVLAVLNIWKVVVESRIAEHLTVEAGVQTVDANDFITRKGDYTAAFITDISGIDLAVPGDYPVEISYRDHKYESVLQVRDTIAPQGQLQDLTAPASQIPDAAEFVIGVTDATQVTAAYLEEPDASLEGEQTVTVVLTDAGGNKTNLQANLTLIFDQEAPVITGAADIQTIPGQEPDYWTGITVTDDLDSAPALTVDTSGVDLATEGIYPVTYTARDSAGNETVVTVNVVVTTDMTPPSILGVNPISLYLGGTVSYRSGILVVDDKDANPTLTVDNSGVDLSQPGVYEVTYTARDASGNQTSITTTVTVSQKTDSYVEPEVIWAAADKIIDRIITDGMTDREKVQAVYDYVIGSFTYIYTSDKTDWMQAAYTMLQNLNGDCFNYYAVTKLLLDRLGIPNITVTRSQDSVRDGRHWWSLVSVDGGLTYYHVDTTPRNINYTGDRNFCLVTDAFLEKYNEFAPGYYTRDMSMYPETPEA